MNREGNYLAADEVVWDRKSGEVRAKGNVVLLTPQGDKLIGDDVQLTDTLRDGTIDNLMVVLESGGGIAAARGRGSTALSTFTNAIYSPCPVTTRDRLPEAAELGDHRGTGHRRSQEPAIRFEGGRLQLSGSTCRSCRFSISPRAMKERPAGWSRTLPSRAATGSSSACPITGSSRAIATRPSHRISTPGCCPRSKPSIANSTASARSSSAAF